MSKVVYGRLGDGYGYNDIEFLDFTSESKKFRIQKVTAINNKYLNSISDFPPKGTRYHFNYYNNNILLKPLLTSIKTDTWVGAFPNLAEHYVVLAIYECV